MNRYFLKALMALMLICMSSVGLGEDIELYISDAVRQAGKSTKVLIIFDNSGSMGTTHTVAEDFNSSPTVTYPPEGAAHAYNDEAIYFNKGGADNSSAIPSSPSDARRFLGDINSCETSKAILAQYGFYTGRIREYSFKGNKGTWNEIPDNNGLNIEILDCEDDAYITDSDGNVINAGTKLNADGLPLGYPVNELGTKNSPIYHDNSDPASTTNVDWSSGGYVTLYTAKYLRWYYGQSVNEVTETRMQTAKKSMVSVINTTPSVDFGLEVFNYNDGDGSSDGNGGRIALGIKEMTTTNKANLLDIINNQISADTWTPLCESVYEASQYFAGAGVEFGDDDIQARGYTKNKPPLDSTIIRANNNYISPFDNCASSIAHIILITDGEPTNDFGADSKITAMQTKVKRLDGDGVPVLDANGDPIYDDKNFVGDRYTLDGSNSYLPALAGWMSEYDINANLEGEQTVVTHTIGFSSGADAARGLLTKTAEMGKGQYFSASSGLQLTQALISILNRLPQSNNSLTSASVAANNIDGTQTLDSIYYAMFEPQTGARWQGNLKKYKAVSGKITGVGGADAFCEVNGRTTFCEDAKSYWSPAVDGNYVSKGGVVSWFQTKQPSDRVLYMDESANKLVRFNRTNLETAFTDTAGLASEFGVAGLVDANGDSIESAAIDEMIAWASGADVDDENNDNDVGDMRIDVFGDPLHSKPLVINYGSSIRILVGTNSGALHMFKDSGTSVEESWAFMPKEFIDNVKELRDNYSSANKVYGIDGEITVHQNDKNGDGIIDGNDTAWIFFGLRRGGSSYYAVDVTNPDTPKLMWHIDDSTAGFSELGQSWSKPNVGYSKLKASGYTASPVLFIGGGYDVNKDSSGAASPDSKGRAVFMLDAETGAILWSATPSGGSTSFAGEHSIASPIATLDSTSNGLVDRLYVGDTGGNIWRFDMPGADKDQFSVFKLANLGGGIDDQRFFYEPDIVRTYISEIVETTVSDSSGATKTITVHQDIPYDAILLGSGDRSNPLGTDTKDTLYMIKDSNIVTQTFSANSTPSIPTAITKGDLYDFTDDPFSQDMTTQQEDALQLEVSQKSGWYVDLLQSGEKATGASLTIAGIAYFTTYTPADTLAITDCIPPEGNSTFYALDLSLGVRKHDAITIDGWIEPPALITVEDPIDPNDPNDPSDPTDPPLSSTYLIIKDFSKKLPDIYQASRSYIYATEAQ